jgi:hypothetical protein
MINRKKKKESTFINKDKKNEKNKVKLFSLSYLVQKNEKKKMHMYGKSKK